MFCSIMFPEYTSSSTELKKFVAGTQTQYELALDTLSLPDVKGDLQGKFTYYITFTDKVYH